MKKKQLRELGEAFAWVFNSSEFIKKEQARRDAVNGKSFKIKIPAKVNEATELYKAQGNDYWQITLMISLKSQMMIMILSILNCIIKIFFYGFHKPTLIKMLT